MLEPLHSILDEPWKPVSRPAHSGWLMFYAAFLVYAYRAHGGGLFIDMANLVVHEGGHNLFGWFGPTLGLWGGTLLQWLVPFLLAAYFFKERETAGFVFSLFFFFENWLYTATYMADARAQVLPLVTTGDPEFVEHDWCKIFSSMGVLEYDTKIAAVVRLLGWLGMMGVVAWFALRANGTTSKNANLHAEEGTRFLSFLAERQAASLPPAAATRSATARKDVAGAAGAAGAPGTNPSPAVSKGSSDNWYPRVTQTK
jgi:hypothetical protein